jgi:hypothetical protein
VVASNSESDKGSQKAVVRHLTDEMLSPPPSPENRPADSERAGSNVSDQLPDPGSILKRVCELSIGETDKIIQELQKVRGFLASEGDRVRREIADYLNLAQSTISSTKTMSETVANLDSAAADVGKRTDF